MRVYKYGHACLLVETENARLLLDPGGFSAGFEEISDVSAILITHEHGDHLNLENIQRVMSRNPEARLIADRSSAATLRKADFDVEVAEEGTSIDAGATIEVVGKDHAVIHPDLPQLVNHGYLIDAQLLHPGDALTVPPQDVEVLALPIGAPWLKSSEFIDYLRKVHPATAIPIHDAVLAKPQIAHNLVDQLGPDDVDYVVVDDGNFVDL